MWDKGGTVRAGDCIFYYGKGNENHQLVTGFFVHHRIVSAAKKEDFVSDWMSHIVLRGCWVSECACTTWGEKMMIQKQFL